MGLSFVHMFPFCLGFFYGYGFGLVLSCYQGCSVLTLEGSPLGQILADWSMYSYNPMTKKELIFYCNTAWPMYTLDYEEK